MTVYGNIFVRPRSNITRATTTAAQRRRRLQQSSMVTLQQYTPSSKNAHITCNTTSVAETLLLHAPYCTHMCMKVMQPMLDALDRSNLVHAITIAILVTCMRGLVTLIHELGSTFEWAFSCTGTSSTSSNTTSSLSANLTQITNLTNAWQLDPANLTQQFGLHIYGSGATTGLIVESGNDQVMFHMRAYYACKHFLVC